MTPISCFHQFFFSVFGSFTAITYWKMVCEMVNGNIVIDYDVKGIMKKQRKGTCLILSGRLPNTYQSLLYQKYQSQKKAYICKFANYRPYMPYVLVCIICLYAFAHYVPTYLYILRTHVLAYLCILRAYVPDVSLLMYMPTQPQYFEFVTGLRVYVPLCFTRLRSCLPYAFMSQG